MTDTFKLTAFNNANSSDYSVFRQDRIQGSGGGVLLAIKNSLKCNFVAKYASNHCECVIVDIEMCKNVMLRTGVVYRPPNANLESSNDMFQFLVTHFDNAKNYVIYGDFNFPDINWESFTCSNNISNSFVNVCYTLGATQCVNFPTRGQNILDLVLCSDRNLIQNIVGNVPLGMSDHDSIVMKLQPLTREAETQPLRPDFKKADYNLINSFLITLDWADIYKDCIDAQDYFKAFMNVINTVIYKFVPFVNDSPKVHIPWQNDNIKRLRKIKQRRWQRYRSRRNVVNYAKYQESAKELQNASLKSKCAYEKNLFDGKSIDCRKFYNYIRKHTTVCSSIPCMKSADNTLATSDYEKANLFSEYFSTVFTEDNGIMPEFNVDSSTSIDGFKCDIKAMIKIIKKLKVNSAPGPDLITAYFLKNTVANIAKPLSMMYNICLDEGFVPSEWKVAHIIPIYKKGDVQCPSNYRPVSLTSVLCKVLERVIREQIMSYLFETNRIPRNQHGFLPRKSTVTNLLECLEDWSLNFDRGVQTDIIYLDYSKCFDTVVHSKLLHKLSKYGFKGVALGWLENFLMNRIQSVKVGNTVSPSRYVTSGVPQGTVIGPLMFICFSADLNSVIEKCTTSMYADDTKIYKGVQSITDCETLQKNLNKIFNWASAWQLKLNANKTKHLRIGKKRLDFVYQMDGKEIETVDSICDIGVNIQSNLRFTNHCNSLVRKAHFVMRNLFNTFKCHDIKFYVSLYCTYVRPILESSSPIWSPFLKSNIDSIESVQRYFTRRLPGLRDLSYFERLDIVKLETLESRRIKADLFMLYKMTNNCTIVNIPDSYRYSLSTRGNSKNLYRFYSKTDTRKHFWVNRVVPKWNDLSDCQVNARDYVNFKNCIKNVKYVGRGSAYD